MADFMKSLKKSHCPYDHELKFSKKMADFMKSIENLHCPYYNELKLSQK